MSKPTTVKFSAFSKPEWVSEGEYTSECVVTLGGVFAGSIDKTLVREDGKLITTECFVSLYDVPFVIGDHCDDDYLHTVDYSDHGYDSRATVAAAKSWVRKQLKGKSF